MMVYFKTNFVFGLLARLLLTETARVLFLVIFLKRKRLFLSFSCSSYMFNSSTRLIGYFSFGTLT